jgi:hypothetical protein
LVAAWADHRGLRLSGDRDSTCAPPPGRPVDALRPRRAAGDVRGITPLLRLVRPTRLPRDVPSYVDCGLEPFRCSGVFAR